MSTTEEFEETSQTSLSKVVLDLRKSLLEDYQCPPLPPDVHPVLPTLTASQRLSLQHFIAWSKSRGTVAAYRLHAEVLQKASDVEILTLYQARKLATELTGLESIMADMCPASCIAYTGVHETLEFCPFLQDGKNKCGEAQYKDKLKPSAKNKPCAQVMILPIVPTIKALFANKESSRLMRARDSILQQTCILLLLPWEQELTQTLVILQYIVCIIQIWGCFRSHVI